MEYNWDKEKLKALKKDLITFRKQNKYLFPEEKQVIKTYLIWIKELEDRLYLPKEKYFSLNWPIRYVDKEKFLPKYTLDDYRSIPKNIRKLILNSTHTLHFFEDNYEGIELPKTKLSDNDFIELSHDFFDWLPNKKYKKIASKFLDKNRNLLRIEKEKQLQNYYGLTYPFYYPRYLPYILVSKKGNINDFCTLNHEIAHGICFHPNKTSFSNTNQEFLQELEGYFFDYLSFQFLIEKNLISTQILKELEYRELIDVIDEIIAFYFQYLEISLYSKKKKITIEDVLNKMLEHHMPFEINEYFLLDFSEEESRYLAKCIISFLTNIDLEKMFTQDRELSFLNFEKIRYNKTNDIEKNLREHGITFMDDKYQNLQEKMQKLSLIKK